MKIPWGAVWTVVKAVYVAFLKGKVVNVPGLGPVTLPQQGQTIPTSGGGQLEMPHRAGSRTILPLVMSPNYEGPDRRAPKPPRKDGLPEAVPPDPPLSVPTLGVILFVVFGLPIIGLTILGVLEWRTLADNTPGNHVTATLRAAWKREPGAVFLASLVWIVFLTSITWGLLGHVFFQ